MIWFISFARFLEEIPQQRWPITKFNSESDLIVEYVNKRMKESNLFFGTFILTSY